jgi:hypothetical protein
MFHESDLSRNHAGKRYVEHTRRAAFETGNYEIVRL